MNDSSKSNLNMLNHYTRKQGKLSFEVFMEYSNDNIQKQNGLSEIILEYIKTSKNSTLNILDIGCGTGTLITAISKTICQHLNKLKLTEVDLSPDMLEQTKANIGTISNQNIESNLLNSTWAEVNLYTNNLIL